MSGTKRCKSCGNPVDLEAAQAHDGACPWCLAAFTFSPEPVGNPATASKDPSKQFGKYVRTEKLGAGGMGEVWKALDTELNRWVALKFLKDEDPSVVARFQREAKTAAALSHPNIAAIYEVGEIEGRHYIAMQLVQGRTLGSFQRDNRKLIVALIRDAARAIDHAHRHGIIHRDVKPENLMVERTDEGWRMVVLDFGLARPIEGGERLSMSGDVVGTPAYLSPEQARGEKLDERADLYSLGATLYEVLTGKPPFEGSGVLDLIKKIEVQEPRAPRKLDPSIPRDLETVALKCLEKEPSRRYDTGKDLAVDLTRWLEGDAVRARPASTIYRLRMKLAKRKAAVAAVVAVACLIGSSAYFVPRWLAEAAARKKQETAARERKERFERARPHLEAGRKILQRVRTRMRAPYVRKELVPVIQDGLSSFRRALKEAPDQPEAHFEIALVQALVNEKKAALESLDRAIAADADFTPAYLERVRLLINDYEGMRHDWYGSVAPENPEAMALRRRLESDLRMVERFSREFPQQKYAQALMAFAQGDYAKTAADLERYLEREPDDGLAHYCRGHALWHLKRGAEAIEALTRAIACDSGDVESLDLRGMAKGSLGDYAGSIDDLTRSIEINPGSAPAYTNRGQTKEMLGLHDEAIADHTTAIALKPEFPLSYCNRGVAKSAKGLFDEAMADFTTAIKLDPKCSNAYLNRSWARHNKGLHDEAAADIAKAIELDPSHPQNYIGRGVMKSLRGRFDEAIEDFTKAIELGPNDPLICNAYANRGNAKRSKILVEEALADYKKALELAPPGWPNRAFYEAAVADYDLERLFKAGIKLLEGKKCREAIENFKAIVKARPKGRMGAVAAYNIACGFAILKDKEEGLDWLEKSIEMGFNDGAHVEEDPDLESLRGEERYRKLVERLKSQ